MTFKIKFYFNKNVLVYQVYQNVNGNLSTSKLTIDCLKSSNIFIVLRIYIIPHLSILYDSFKFFNIIANMYNLSNIQRNENGHCVYNLKIPY